MKPEVRSRGDGSRFEAIPSLLQSCAEVVGARLELFLPNHPVIVTQPPAWDPGARCEILSIPITPTTGPGGRLLALFRQNGRNGGSPPAQRPIALLENLGQLLSEQLCLASHVEELTGELDHRSGELDLLHAISGHLAGEEDVRRAIRSILRRARDTIGAEAAFVALDSRKLFEAAFSPGIDGDLRSACRLWRRVGSEVSFRLMNGSGSYFIGSLADLGVGPIPVERPARVLAVAIRPRLTIEGALGLVHFGSASQRTTEIRLLESLAEKIATVLANVELYDDLRDFLMATVKSLVSAIDAKDPYTSGHSERVNILSMLLGKTMSLDPMDLEVLRWASLLHDVGKIGMPEEILKKPGRLTPEEYEIVKEHPDRGYKVLSPIRQLSAASMGVRCHHEMFDGTGYPLGLGGTEIPLTARIIAVADTYDSLTTNRSYRSGRSPDAAFDVIRNVRGTQLDPNVVDRMEQLMPFLREHQVMIQPDIGEFTETEPNGRRAA